MARTFQHQNIAQIQRAQRLVSNRHKSENQDYKGHTQKAYTPISGQKYHPGEAANEHYIEVVAQPQAESASPSLAWALLLAAALGCTQSVETGISYISPNSPQPVTVDPAADFMYQSSVKKGPWDIGVRTGLRSHTAHFTSADGYGDTDTLEADLAGVVGRGHFYGFLGLRNGSETTQGVVQFGPSIFPYTDTADLAQLMAGMGIKFNKGGLVMRIEVEHAANLQDGHDQTRARAALGYQKGF